MVHFQEYSSRQEPLDILSRFGLDTWPAAGNKKILFDQQEHAPRFGASCFGQPCRLSCLWIVMHSWLLGADCSFHEAVNRPEDSYGSELSISTGFHESMVSLRIL